MTATKFVAMLGVIAFAITLQVLTLIYGWGLEIKNLWAIIFLGFFGQIFVHSIGKKVLEDK